jgi:hypothetical protein
MVLTALTPSSAVPAQAMPARRDFSETRPESCHPEVTSDRPGYEDVAAADDAPANILAIRPGPSGYSRPGTLREDSFDRVKSVTFEKELTMLWTVAVVLLLLWLLGMVSSYTLGGFIHILLVLAVVTVLIRLITGRKMVQ